VTKIIKRIKNVCKRVVHYCRLFKRGGGKNATIRYKGRRPGKMALLIVQVHRKWSGLNAWPDESVFGHRSFDCREEGSPLPLRFSSKGGGSGRHVFYNVVWYAATYQLRPPPIHARINSEFPNCPSPILSSLWFPNKNDSG